MNLPSYSLFDAPVSNVVNVSLGTLASSSSVSASSAPLPPPAAQRLSTVRTQDVKGKGRARTEAERDVQEEGDDSWGDDESEQEEWEDAQGWASLAASKFAALRATSAATATAVKRKEGQEGEGGWDQVFATATTEGFAIYSLNPLGLVHQHVVKKASLKMAVPLQLSNIVFLVGGPPSPMFEPNSLVIYDLATSSVALTLTFPSPVLGISARRDRLLVILLRKVVLYVLGEGSASAVWREGSWDTCENKRGLGCIATEVGSGLVVVPGRQPGQVSIVNIPAFHPSTPPPPRPSPLSSAAGGEEGDLPPYPTKAVIVAHTTPLAALSVTPSGSLIATASETGTLVRLWDPKTGAMMRELRRGADGAEIWAVRLRRDGLGVAVSSDKGTVHVWDLSEAREKQKERRKEEEARPVSLSILKPYLPRYFHSQWSDAHFRLPPPAPAPPRSLPLPQLFPDPSAPTVRPSKEARKVPTIEDDVCLVAWIEGAPEPPPRPPPSSRRPRRPTQVDSATPAKLEPQVVAITRSGGWYRLALPDSTAPSSAPSSSSTPKEPSSRPASPSTRVRKSSSSGLGGSLGVERSVEMKCLEYRKFGEVDEWDEERELEAGVQTEEEDGEEEEEQEDDDPFAGLSSDGSSSSSSIGALEESD